jgi:YidC/Oxa1 family membrane protein insertase
MYSLPIFKQLVLLLQWILISMHNWLSSLGLSEHWTWGLAIIGLTIIVRLVLFPLTWKQFSSSQRMMAIQPKIKELQKKHKGDRATLQAETMKLYQEHRVNPFASCLPLLLQLPVFISLFVLIDNRADYLNQVAMDQLSKASFLWIPKLGEPDPYYILLVLYVVSQLVSTELMLSAQSDKTQKMIMRMMPIVFVFFLYRFPAGLFVYWVTTNLWTIGQQLIIRKVMKPRLLAAGPAKPARRSRFMEAMSKAQEQRMTTREELLAKQSDKTGGGAGGDAKPAAKKQPAKKGGRKPPPGKGKRKSGAPPSTPKSQSGPAGT